MDDDMPIRQREVEVDTDDSQPVELSSQAKNLLANLIHVHKKAPSGNAKAEKPKNKHNIVHQAVSSDDVADKAAGHKVIQMRHELTSDLRVGPEGLKTQKADLQKDVVTASTHASADAKAAAIAKKLFRKMGAHSTMSASNLRSMIQQHLNSHHEQKSSKMKKKLHIAAEEILEDLKDAQVP